MQIPVLVTTPEWLAASIVIVAIALALLAAVAMFRRVKTTSGDDTGHSQPAYIDTVLLLSAAGVIALALAAWALR